MLGRAFDAFSQITEPGTIIDVMFKWRREQYPRSPWLERPNAIEAARNNAVIPAVHNATSYHRRKQGVTNSFYIS